MKYLSLETFTDFNCSASECPFTCCGGWNIYIDPDTDRYYQTVTGEMGKRLHDNISRNDGKSSFILTETGRCPFLNEKDLCDIYLNLGEEHLCVTCTVFPRYMYQAGDIQFSGVSISCPEVARFLLSHSPKIEIDYCEDDNEVDYENMIDWEKFNSAIRMFVCSIDIAQNRSLKIKERIALITLMVSQFQTLIYDNENPDGLISLFSDPNSFDQILPGTQIESRDFTSKALFCSEIMSLFSQVKNFKTVLPELAELVDHFGKPENANIDMTKWGNAYAVFDNDDEQIRQEQILVYILFRYLMQGFENNDYYNKYITGLELVFSADICTRALSYIKDDNVVDLEQGTMMIAHLSRLIEHSRDYNNLALKHLHNKGIDNVDYILKLIS